MLMTLGITSPGSIKVAAALPVVGAQVRHIVDAPIANDKITQARTCLQQNTAVNRTWGAATQLQTPNTTMTVAQMLVH